MSTITKQANSKQTNSKQSVTKQSSSDQVQSSIVRRNSAVSDELQHSSLHPLLKKIYANRGVTHLKQVDYSLKDLLDYSLLKDVNLAAEIVSKLSSSKKTF